MVFDQTEVLPYTGAAYRQAIGRLCAQPMIRTIISQYFDGDATARCLDDLESVYEVNEFHAKLIAPLIDQILIQSSKGLWVGGLEGLQPSQKYLFMSNHRDIVADPALFTYALFRNQLGTPKICLGDNLLTSPLICDLVKLNKGVTVRRQLAGKNLLRAARELSQIINQEIRHQSDSVWLAQREGRAKTGIDETQVSVLRMLCLTQEGSPVEVMLGLNITPVSISYEYDPCDLFKARELVAIAHDGQYIKAAHEDTQSMINGICAAKGRIQIQIGSPLNALIQERKSFLETLPPKEQIVRIAEMVDRQIGALYRIWPTHYIAADLLTQRPTHLEHYSPQEAQAFRERLDEKLQHFPPEARPAIEKTCLQIYANAVFTHLERLVNWGPEYQSAWSWHEERAGVRV